MQQLIFATNNLNKIKEIRLVLGKKFDIIRDGRFVIPGTEELNIPLQEG